MVKSNEEEIIIGISENSGLPWPYYKGQKALSSSTLTRILKEIEYGDKQIPKHVLIKAANNGKLFHETIQNFLETGEEGDYLLNCTSKKTLEKIEESILFFKKNKFDNFIGSEKLHHRFHKETFFGSYVDLEFDEFAIELKTNNIIINESPISVLVFKIQMLIQKICTGKDIYLLWSTGQGVFFNKFEENEELFKILQILVETVYSKGVNSYEAKKEIVERVLEVYASGDYEKKLLNGKNINGKT